MPLNNCQTQRSRKAHPNLHHSGNAVDHPKIPAPILRAQLPSAASSVYSNREPKSHSRQAISLLPVVLKAALPIRSVPGRPEMARPTAPLPVPPHGDTSPSAAPRHRDPAPDHHYVHNPSALPSERQVQLRAAHHNDSYTTRGKTPKVVYGLSSGIGADAEIITFPMSANHQNALWPWRGHSQFNPTLEYPRVTQQDIGCAMTDKISRECPGTTIHFTTPYRNHNQVPSNIHKA